MRILAGPAVLLLLHCGGGAASSGFTVEPEPRTVLVGEQLALSARPAADLAGDLEWQVQEPYGGGLRNSVGEATVYFAPPAAGTYHLILRGDRTDGRRMKETVEVRVLPVPSLEPTSPQVPPGGSVTFTATMKGLPRNTVNWAIEEPNGGEIAEDGRYQAPTRPGSYHVTATSTFDPQAIARATVVVAE
jgi:hypothetical protein